MESLENFNNLDTCCRTCLNNTSDRMYINILAVRDDSVSVAEMLATCTSIKVRSNDKLPQKVCGACYSCLSSFYDFKRLAEHVNTKLWKHLQECCYSYNVPEAILKEIKTEIEVVGINNYHTLADDEQSDIYTINGEVNGSSEPGCSQTDTTNLRNSTNDSLSDNQDIDTIDTKPSDTNKSYTCDICSGKFKRRYEFIRHLVTHGEGSNLSTVIENTNQSVKCDECSAIFQSMNSLSAHKKKHVNKDRVLSCTICDKVFKKLSHLKRHEIVHEDNRPHKCLICLKSFATESILNEHVNSHNGIRPHQCPLCPKSFSHMSSLTNHLKNHLYRERRYLCPTCGKKFDCRSNLNQHVLRHTGVKMYACDLCPRKFVSKGELKCHGTTHTGQRSYTCDQCGSAFTKSSGLARHKIVHTGIKPYRCTTCSAIFSYKADLKRHYRIHTGEKPYQCEVCERAFSQNSDLIRHQQKSCCQNKYRCNQCPNTFQLKSELHRHISNHYLLSQIIPEVVLTKDDHPTGEVGVTSNLINENTCDTTLAKYDARCGLSVCG